MLSQAIVNTPRLPAYCLAVGLIEPLFLSLQIMRGKPSITIADESRKRAIASIQRYVADNLDQEIGDLKAALVLDYFLAEHGPTIYNKAIADAKAFFDERAADLGAICYHAEFPFWDARKRSP